jgi:hypothetical protein
VSKPAAGAASVVKLSPKHICDDIFLSPILHTPFFALSCDLLGEIIVAVMGCRRRATKEGHDIVEISEVGFDGNVVDP